MPAKTGTSVADQLATAATFDPDERIRRLELIATGAVERTHADARRLQEAREHIVELDEQLQLSRREIASLTDQIRKLLSELDSERGRHARELGQLRAKLSQEKQLADELECVRRQRCGTYATFIFGLSLATFVATCFLFFAAAVLGWVGLAVTVALWVAAGVLLFQRGMGQAPDDLADISELAHVTTGPLPVLNERRES